MEIEYEQVVLGIIAGHELLHEDMGTLYRLWFERLDTIYFSSKTTLLLLRQPDIYLIRHSHTCHEKLRALQFKEGVKIEGYYTLRI